MTRIDENHSTEMADKRNGVLPADVFGVLCEIGEIAGIMRDIAAREISESKPIAGTAIDMLAKMIEAAVADGMGDAPADNPGQHQFVAEDSQIDPEAFEPPLDTLMPWRDRVLAARDALEAEAPA